MWAELARTWVCLFQVVHPCGFVKDRLLEYRWSCSLGAVLEEGAWSHVAVVFDRMACVAWWVVYRCLA